MDLSNIEFTEGQGISISDIRFCRKMIVIYGNNVNRYKNKIQTCKPKQRGIYTTHRAQALKDVTRMKGNLQGQLDWLKLNNYSLFEEVSK